MGISTELGESGTADSQVRLSLGTLRGIENLQKAKHQVHRVIQNGPTTIRLDFESIHGVSSDLISFLIWCQMECSRNRVQLQVQNVSPEALKVFRFAGLNQVIDLNPPG